MLTARALEIVGMLLILLNIFVVCCHLVCMTDVPMMSVLGAIIILSAGRTDLNFTTLKVFPNFKDCCDASQQ